MILRPKRAMEDAVCAIHVVRPSSMPVVGSDLLQDKPSLYEIYYFLTITLISPRSSNLQMTNGGCVK